MGLDMYLYAKRYLMAYPEGNADSQIASEIADIVPVPKGFPVKEVKIEAGYWRKANAIHKWFVDNIQKGKDDCGNYYVTRERLIELRGICQRVLDFKHLAEGQLPTQSGFFFGATEYDEGYYDDLIYTVEMINQALTLTDDWDFEYHSSW